MGAFEAIDEREKRLGDSQLDGYSMHKTIVHGHDNEGYSKLGNDSKANKSLHGAY